MNLKNALKALPLFGLAFVCTLAACDSDENSSIVASIVLSEDQTAVSADFTVPSVVSGTEISWSSSDESVVKVCDGEDGTKTMGVIRPTDESKKVTLTAKVGKATKDFSVTVNPVDVYEIAESFEFASDNSLVYDAEISAPTSYTYSYTSAALTDPQTYTATVTWTTDNSELVTIANDKLTVSNSLEVKTVKVYALFEYGSRTSKYTYTLNVWKELTPYEQLVYYTDNVGNGEYNTLEGYVIAKAGYNESYGEGNFYILNSDLTGGYYIYNAYMNKTDYDALALGTFVTFTKVKSYNYNGWIETTYGSTASIDKEATKLDMTTLTATPIDNELLIDDCNELIYRQNNYVSLTGWKVMAVGSVSASSSDSYQTALTLVKDDFKILVKVNKALTALDSTAVSSIISTLATISVGDYVNITGILTFSTNYQILVYDANSITKVEAEVEVEGAKLANADLALLDNIKTAYTEDTTVTLPTATNGSFTYSLKYSSYKSVTLADGVLTITPREKKETVILLVEYSYTNETLNKTYSVSKQITITTQVLDDQGKAEADATSAVSSVNNATIDTVLTLPTTGQTYGATLSDWTVSDGNGVAAIVDGKLYIVPGSEAKTVTLTCTSTVNGTAYNCTLTVNVGVLTVNIYDEYVTACTDKTLVVVKGVVVAVEYAASKKIVFVQDLTDSTKAYQAYNLSMDDTAYAALEIGDVVYVSGTGTTYSGVLELASGCTLSNAYKLDGTNVTATPAVNDITSSVNDESDLSSLQSNLIKVTGTITSVSGTAATINCGTKTFKIYLSTYFHAKTTEDYINTKALLVEGLTATFTGIYDGSYKNLSLRSSADISYENNEANLKAFLADSIYDVLPTEISEVADGGNTYTLPATFNSLAVTYSTESTAVNLSSNVLTVSALPTEDTTVSITATITISAGVTYQTAVTTKLVAPAAEGTYNAIMSYSGSTTTSMTEEGNATTVGLDSSIFTVTAAKNGASNLPGLNQDGTIRLYYDKTSGNGSSFTVTTTSNYVITSIKITLNLTTTFEVNGTSITDAKTSEAKEVEINSTSFTIKNTSTSSQLRISSIDITYQAASSTSE